MSQDFKLGNRVRIISSNQYARICRFTEDGVWCRWESKPKVYQVCQIGDFEAAKERDADRAHGAAAALRLSSGTPRSVIADHLDSRERIRGIARQRPDLTKTRIDAFDEIPDYKEKVQKLKEAIAQKMGEAEDKARQAKPAQVVGCLAKLKSGGPLMTITHLSDNGQTATCSWFDCQKLIEGRFPVDSLNIREANARPSTS